MNLRDGLYRIEHGGICAGFVIEDGRLAACAPILRKHIRSWVRLAVWLGP